MEEELDNQFFVQNNQLKELKLNKGEKRALKFAINRGDKIDQIPNLKEWLQEQVKAQKNKKNLKGILLDK